MKSSLLMNISIRRATVADIDSIITWQIAMAQETEGLVLDRATVRRGVTHVFESPNLGYYLVADVEGQLAGCMLVLSEWSDWRAGMVLWLHSVYIEPPKRKMGVFKAFYECVKKSVMNDSKLRGIRLYVDKSNKSAASVYRKLGMSSEHYELFEWMVGESD